MRKTQLRLVEARIALSGPSRTPAPSALVSVESGALHATLRFLSFHERLPQESSAQVLGHQHGDARVDPDHVVVVPVFQWVEGIDKAILAPGGAVTAANRFEHSHTRRGNKWQRSGAGARYYSSVNRTEGRRTTPDHITFFRIGGGDSPKIIAVGGELLAQLNAETAMDFRRYNRVLKIIGVLVALSAKIEPRLRVLMQ